MKRYATIGTLVLWAIIGLQGNGWAQTNCANYGDPIINITFGNAANPMDRLPDDVTDYRLYTGGGAFMPVGDYMITDNAIKGNNGRSVFLDFTDHTGDEGGGMLLVNADFAPGIFYTEVQPNLCPNTDFTFSAWVINASPADLCDSEEDFGNSNTLIPNVLFEIYTVSGELIRELPTGPIYSEATPRWRYYEVSFNTGDNTDVILIMRNIGPGGCGNNLAIDDIQFRPCGPSLSLTPSVQPTDNHTIRLCGATDEVTFSSDIGLGYGNPVYQWQAQLDGEIGWQDIPGARNTSLTVSPTHGTSYRLTVAANEASLQNHRCRVVSDPIRVAQLQAPLLDLVPGTHSVCLDNLPVLDPGDFVWPDTGPLTYQWYERRANEWHVIQHGVDASFRPDVRESGVFTFQRRAVNACGVQFATNEFEVVVRPSTETSLRLPIDLFCLVSEEIQLTGGMPETFNGQPGIYSGAGVVNGVFYPARAGVGEHVITYSPPVGSDCPMPSTVTIRVIDAVYVTPMVDHIIVRNQAIRLIPETNATRFAWDIGSPGLSDYHIANPIATPVSTTTYRLTVNDDAGCEETAMVTVRVLELLDIPNGFTPNGDGINDVWEIEGLEHYPNVHVQVFGRSGGLVFSSRGYGEPWDGRLNGNVLPAATYYYVISSDVLDRPLNGAVTIIR